MVVDAKAFRHNLSMRDHSGAPVPPAAACLPPDPAAWRAIAARALDI
ncbi:MAG: hypothetical protein HY911_15175 [Desulfobacterales bacterium]|nr:hypothetical protein [Desulfobacterales bacterium]